MKFNLVLHFFGYFLLKNALSSHVTHTSICSSETDLRLNATGLGSSLSLSLVPNIGQSTGSCKLRVTAPESHIVHVNIIEDEDDIGRIPERKGGKSCLLSVYLPENRRTAIWRSDPCSQDILPEGGLLTHQLRIVWNLPVDKTHTRGRKLIVTALGQGETCQSESQHTCLRVGWSPMMCVAKELICDGIPHCPIGATTSDEDQQLCKDKKVMTPSSWEKIAAEFFKKFTGKSANLMPTIQANEEGNWFLGKDLLKTTTEKSSSQEKNLNKEPPNIDSLSAALSHYGPWGYLMLGMLICGTVLMLCGLWECCCRQNKPMSDTSSTPSQPTTVLIINPQSAEENQPPPNYEDLDQPPSYNVLFPAKPNNSCSSRPNETV